MEKKIKPKEGSIITTSWEVLWKHKWVFYYTIGQRKWLDIWWLKSPVYDEKKDIEKNEIIVWTEKDLELYDDKLKVKNMHFLCKSTFSFPLKAKAKIRYRQEDQDCVIEKEDSEYLVKFKNKQRAIASGQICAMYLDDELVMSGVID